MYVNDDELADRVERTPEICKPSSARILRLHTARCGDGPRAGKHTTVEERAHAVVLSRLFGGHAAASAVTGIHKDRISRHAHGVTTQGRVDPKLTELVKTETESARDHAARLVLETLGVISTEEIAEQKVGKKVQIAQNLANIVDKLTPKDKQNITAQHANVIFYSPRVREVTEYEVVEDAVSR